jgi:ankyrin repeat protein
VFSSPFPHALTLVSHFGPCALPLLSGYGAQLLQYKADINAVNEHGNVPLHYACFWGQDQVAEVRTQAFKS